MTLATGILFQLAMVVWNIVMAKVEAYRFDVRQMKINHTFAACCYVFTTLWGLLFIHSYKWNAVFLWLAFLVMHFPVFSIALNMFRIPPRPWDYHNTTDTNGSKLDLWLGKYYVEAIFGSVAVWVFLQFLIFWK